MANSTAWGFIGLKDLYRERVMDNLPIVMGAIEQSIAEYQRQIDEMLNILVRPVTEYSIRYQLPGNSSLQPLDEWGNPKPVIPSGYYDIAFPIQGAGIAWGDNRITRQLMTVQDAARFTATVQNADIDWLRRHILSALFTNTTWTYTDPDHGSLTIQPLANGDSVTYVRRGGTSSTDNHFLAQADAIDNSHNPFPTLYAELMEHPSNDGPYVAYIPSNLKTTVMALSTFVEINDPDIQVGVNNDTVVGTLARGMGDEVLGKSDKMWIVEWSALPDSYIVAVAQGADPVLGMRQYPVAALQGLFPEFHSPDGNRQLYRFLRYAGFGALNRVGAAIMRIGNGSYAIPTGYSAPLAG